MAAGGRGAWRPARPAWTRGPSAAARPAGRADTAGEGSGSEGAAGGPRSWRGRSSARDRRGARRAPPGASDSPPTVVQRRPFALRVDVGLHRAHLRVVGRELRTADRVLDAPVDHVARGGGAAELWLELRIRLGVRV